MSTDHMPNPPDQPTAHVVSSASQAETPTPDPAGAAQVPISLDADMARIIVEQADVIAQKQFYHSQIMLGVSALGTDIVSAKQSALMVARALLSSNTPTATHTLVKLAEPQYAQVNDRTLPYRFNSQMSGLLQGIILDTITQAYSAEPGKLREAQAILAQLFDKANRDVMEMPKDPPRFQAPAMSPEPAGLALPEAGQRSS